MRYIYIILAVILLGCSQPDKEIGLTGRAFGTSYSIIYFGTQPERIQEGVEAVIAKVNASMSTYIEDSDISKINRGDTTVVVDEMFKDVYTLSRKLNQSTSGYFDPTVGVLRNAYGFGDEKPLEKIDSATLDSLLVMVGWDKVTLNDDGTISKQVKGIYFDFNAVAKGYGIDEIGRYLESQGYTDYLVELGGEVRASGKNLTKDAFWVVGVEATDSRVTNRSYQATLFLENRAMAASGNYRKNRVDPLTGKEYVHTINPLDGTAIQSDVLTATILAPTCAEADAWATACMAMGLERSKEALKQHPEIDAYLTLAEGTFVTEGFEKVLR